MAIDIDVSVIIVNWNTKDMLMKCLRSIYKNKSSRIKEVILVDNASTDGSVEAVKKNFDRVKIIQNKSNLGFAKANNLGIKSSMGKYICLMNSDVEVLNNSIDSMYMFMEKNSDIGVLGPKVLNADHTVRPN